MATKKTKSAKGTKTKKLINLAIMLGASLATDQVLQEVDKADFMKATVATDGTVSKINYKKIGAKGAGMISGAVAAIMVNNPIVEAIGTGIMLASANRLKDDAVEIYETGTLKGLGNTPTFISMYATPVNSEMAVLTGMDKEPIKAVIS